jgi:SAM-dependent methyltransferase
VQWRTTSRRLLALSYGARKWLLRQSWFTSKLLPALPRPIRWALRKLYFLPLDLVERLAGRRSDLVPPMSSIFTGSVDDFQETGRTLVAHLVDLECLAPDSRVLDVGSGMGRLAVALIEYRGERGAYEGLEIVPSGVKWCTERITPTHPTYRFTLADIYNKEYNPDGRLAASAYRFPYDDGAFDLAVLVSVFTHMLADDMEHYVAEIARVLRGDGRCFATFSLLNAESLQRMHAGQTERRFEQVGPHWVVDTKVPELAVAYEEEFVRALFARHGYSCRIYYGSWSGRRALPGQPAFFDQDLVVATRQ